MFTVKDAVFEINGPNGAVVRAMPTHRKAAFTEAAGRLGRQIAADNNVDFETGNVPDETPLSDDVERLLRELRVAKSDLLGLSRK